VRRPRPPPPPLFPFLSPPPSVREEGRTAGRMRADPGSRRWGTREPVCRQDSRSPGRTPCDTTHGASPAGPAAPRGRWTSFFQRHGLVRTARSPDTPAVPPTPDPLAATPCFHRPLRLPLSPADQVSCRRAGREHCRGREEQSPYTPRRSATVLIGPRRGARTRPRPQPIDGHTSVTVRGPRRHTPAQAPTAPCLGADSLALFSLRTRPVWRSCLAAKPGRLRCPRIYPMCSEVVIGETLTARALLLAPRAARAEFCPQRGAYRRAATPILSVRPGCPSPSLVPSLIRTAWFLPLPIKFYFAA